MAGYSSPQGGYKFLRFSCTSCLFWHRENVSVWSGYSMPVQRVLKACVRSLSANVLVRPIPTHPTKFHYVHLTKADALQLGELRSIRSLGAVPRSRGR
jgi:hypothetical protein